MYWLFKHKLLLMVCWFVCLFSVPVLLLFLLLFFFFFFFVPVIIGVDCGDSGGSGDGGGFFVCLFCFLLRVYFCFWFIGGGGCLFVCLFLVLFVCFEKRGGEGVGLFFFVCCC